nr:diaminopimelate epimerase [Kangiella sp. HZ709]
MHFSKMHGLGNDFMVIDGINQSVFLNQAQISRLSHRNFGIGFDQLILIEAPQHPETDFHFRIFNSDGSESGHCGNGARCVAKYVRQRGLSWKKQLRLSTNTATMQAELEDNGLVSINMGAPKFEPEQIPLRYAQKALSYGLEVEGVRYQTAALSMGNPHGVITVPDIEKATVEKTGPALSQHSYFPEQANIGFMQIMDRETIKLRVFERGVGETLACGTGACAAMVVSRLQNLTEKRVKVILPGGSLWIEWGGTSQNHSDEVKMTGPAKWVFEGQIEL